MSKKRCMARPPEREELSNNPVKMCMEISHLFRAKMREKSQDESVFDTHGTRLVLSFLAIGDGVTQLELVNATHMRAPTISVILKNLESEGIVERRKDEKDMRALRVYLTDKGRALDRKNIEKIKQVDAMALYGINEEEFELLMKQLSRIRDNLIAAEKSDSRIEREESAK